MQQTFIRRCIISSAVIFSLGAAASWAADVTVNWNDVKQKVTGFGASTAWDGSTMRNMAEPARTNMMDLLFDTAKGIGLTMIRAQIPTNLETSTGTWNWTGDAGQVWVMQQAQQKYGVTRIWAAPWSPPAWMKSSNSTRGGSLLAQYYQAYADYFSRYVREYKSQFGIHFMGISMQNEPQAGGQPWDCCGYTGEQMRDYIKNYLGPTFVRDTIGATIIASESNIQETQYIDPILADAAAARYVGVAAFHEYLGSGPPYQKAAAMGKELWETETSNMGGNFDLGWPVAVQYAKQIYDYFTTKGANAWHYWWFTCAATGNGTQGLIESANGGYVASKLVYYVGHFSKFVRPGWRMISVTPYVQNGNGGNVHAAAFKDEKTGRFAIIVLNESIASPGPTVTFHLQNFSPSSVTPYLTRGDQAINLQKQTDIPVTNGTFSFQIQNVSIATFIGQGMPTPANASPVQMSSAQGITIAATTGGLKIHLQNPAAGSATLATANGALAGRWEIAAAADQTLALPAGASRQMYVVRLDFGGRTEIRRLMF